MQISEVCLGSHFVLLLTLWFLLGEVEVLPVMKICLFHTEINNMLIKPYTIDCLQSSLCREIE